MDDRELKKLYDDRMKDRKGLRRKKKSHNTELLEDLIHNFFKKDKQALRKIKESQAVMAWPVYVGDAAARVSRAVKVQNKTLIVYVADTMWMHQLSWLKTILLQKYEQNFPELKLKDIFFTTREYR